MKRKCEKYILLFLLFSFSLSIQCQYVKDLTDKNDYSSLYFVNPHKNNGFEISVSAVAMFTAGAIDRSGFRWGAGITLAKGIGDWRLCVGADTYKAKQNFGIGTTFAGFGYNDGNYGFDYYVNKYYQGDAQVSGIINLDLGDFQIRFEDDVLALPFTGFVIHDRYRTAALEVRYRHFLIGTNVYTNEANGLTDVSPYNKKGIYASGKQISSLLYIGYTNKNLIARYGINGKLGGLLGQNWWHQRSFGTPDFKGGEYKNPFIQLGVDKPYTLY